jgi:hypothetical protein
VLVPPEVPPAPAVPEPVPPVLPAPVPPVAAPVPPVAAPVPPVAAPGLGAVPPVAAPLVALPDDDEEEEPVDGVVLDGVLLDAVSLGFDDDALLSLPERLEPPPIDALSGATSACGLLGTSSCVTLLPPQADRPPVASSIRPRAVARRRTRQPRWISAPTEPTAEPSAGRTAGSR